MGAATCACFGEIVDITFVSEQCPTELAALQAVMGEYDVDWQFLGQPNEVADIEHNASIEEDAAKEITEAYVALTEAFEAKTGLELYGVYHEFEVKGDEIDGFAWAVDKVYVLSPAGKKFEKEITRKFWTVGC